MPLLMFTLLAFAEAGFLFASRHTMQTSADVLADVAAERGTGEGWPELVNDEEARSGCVDAETSVTYPDGGQEAGDRVRVDMSCAYDGKVTKGLWPGLRISVQGEAVVRPEPEPSESAAP